LQPDFNRLGDVFRGTVFALFVGMLSYEKLDVYQAAIQFLVVATRVVDELPKGNAALAEQLKRASMSIPLNIAESSGKPSRADRQRFMSIARGSAMECGAILDVCRVLRLTDETTVSEGKSLLVRIVSMLTRLCR
jgi:four helix bundle protein